MIFLFYGNIAIPESIFLRCLLELIIAILIRNPPPHKKKQRNSGKPTVAADDQSEIWVKWSAVTLHMSSQRHSQYDIWVVWGIWKLLDYWVRMMFCCIKNCGQNKDRISIWIFSSKAKKKNILFWNERCQALEYWLFTTMWSRRMSWNNVRTFLHWIQTMIFTVGPTD